MPLSQVSVRVHGLPSSQLAPFCFGGSEHVPVPGSQVPALWHESEAGQTTGFVPTQSPLWQVSVRVQGLASLQAVPFVLLGLEQRPVAGLQVPASWHGSEGVQVTELVPVHVPAWQVSVWVHALPSSQRVPSGFGGAAQSPVVGSQVPAP